MPGRPPWLTGLLRLPHPGIVLNEAFRQDGALIYKHGEAQTEGKSHSTAATVGTAMGATRGTTRAQGTVTGWNEAFEPIMADRPSSVHPLENVKHQAAELLCSLPTGTCVVRCLRNGSIEGAIVQVPERRCAPVDDAQYGADLELVCKQTTRAQRTEAAQAAIEAREQAIIAGAARAISPPEPSSFPGPAPKRRKRKDEV